jgi:hypothetical protein
VMTTKEIITNAKDAERYLSARFMVIDDSPAKAKVGVAIIPETE